MSSCVSVSGSQHPLLGINRPATVLCDPIGLSTTKRRVSDKSALRKRGLLLRSLALGPGVTINDVTDPVVAGDEDET